MKSKKRVNTAKMVEMSVLIAIIFLMAFTPIGYIKTPTIDITLLVIPVGVGAVVLGPMAGAVLGLAFGITSLILSFSSPLGALMIGISPVYRVISCIVPRVLCGLLAGLVYVGMKKVAKLQKFALVAANLACPMFNTVLFMGTFMLLYYDTAEMQGIIETLGVSNPIALIVAIVGINAVIEAIACFIIGSAVSKGLQVALKIRK